MTLSTITRQIKIKDIINIPSRNWRWYPNAESEFKKQNYIKKQKMSEHNKINLKKQKTILQAHGEDRNKI